MADFRFFDFNDLRLLCIDAEILQSLIFSEYLSVQWGKFRYHDFYYLQPICASIIRDLNSTEQLCLDSNSFNREHTRLSVLAVEMLNRYYYADDDGFNGKFSYLLQDDIENACYKAGYPALDIKLIPQQIICDEIGLAIHINAAITGDDRIGIHSYKHSLDIRAAKEKALIYALCFNAVLYTP